MTLLPKKEIEPLNINMGSVFIRDSDGKWKETWQIDSASISMPSSDGLDRTLSNPSTVTFTADGEASPSEFYTLLAEKDWCNTATTSTFTTSTFTVSPSEFEDLKKLVSKLESQLEDKPTFVELECQQCGAHQFQRIDDHIFKCSYCKTAYMTGTKMLLSSYRSRNPISYYNSFGNGKD